MIRFLLLLLLFFPTLTHAADLPTQLQFADSLASEGDHYRAITEYKRFLFLNPDSELRPRAQLSIAKNLLAGHRWSQADNSLEELFRLYPQSPEAAKGRRIYADSAYERGEFGLARERYRALLKEVTDPPTINYANFRIGWSLLEQDRPQQSARSFSLLPEPQRNQLATDLENYQSLKLKSPRLAGTLSALLPGLGQLYTGRVRQATLAFLLNGAFILGAVEAIHNQNYAAGGILLFFELGWYGGNIYNATNNAHKFNQRTKNDFKHQMRSRLNLQLGMLPQVPMVVLNYRF
ncbi:tetratricopeptide repeat protein [Geopsychrobacter electrodiphilus]|uniref:tetratricopeptide repeat protein n=1 Tax=Geopsychrobacter electrodiphilus TaxID=225196 RepID=UPI00036B6FAF|nr:tetratricopeptide repeat protein [Geopsychrobacter electrodiphilus]